MAGMMRAFVVKGIGAVGFAEKRILEPDPNDAVVSQCQDMHGGWKFANVKDGVFAGYFHVNDGRANLTPIPDAISDEVAVFCADLLSTGFMGPSTPTFHSAGPWRSSRRDRWDSSRPWVPACSVLRGSGPGASPDGDEGRGDYRAALGRTSPSVPSGTPHPADESS